MPFTARGYSGINTLDRISLAATALGGVILVFSLLFDSDGLQLGAGLIVVGLLVLVRALPGEGG